MFLWRMGCWDKIQQPWCCNCNLRDLCEAMPKLKLKYTQGKWEKLRNIVLYSARHCLELCLPNLQIFIDKNKSVSYNKWNLVSVTFLSLMSLQWSYVSVIEWKIWTAACLSTHFHVQWLGATHKLSILSEPINNIICTGFKQKCKKKKLI